MTQLYRKISHFASLLLFIAFMSGCASTPAPSNVSVEGVISASNVLNPDLKGGYRPVNIKIFYLKSAEGFADASFTDLYKYPDKILGENILDLKTQQVLPGQSLRLADQVPLGLKYIAVIAAYRNLDEASWKDIKPVPEKCFTCTGAGLWEPISIRLERLAVSLDTGVQSDPENSDYNAYTGKAEEASDKLDKAQGYGEEVSGYGQEAKDTALEYKGYSQEAKDASTLEYKGYGN